MSALTRIFASFVLLAMSGTALAQAVTLPDVERIELDNGTVLLLYARHDVPLIGIEAVIRGGAVSDPADKAGLSNLLAGLMEKGAGDRDSAEFAEAVAACMALPVPAIARNRTPSPSLKAMTFASAGKLPPIV